MAKSLEEALAEATVAIVALTAALGSGKAAVAPKATTTKAATTKVPTVAAIKKAAEDFLEAAGKDEPEYAARRAHIKEIVAKFDAPKLTEVKEGERQEALDLLAAYVPTEADGDSDI